MKTSLQTLESWHGAILAAQRMNEGLFRERIDTIKTNPLPIDQVMSDVRAFIGGVVAGESKPLMATAMGLIDKKKYGEYHTAAEAAVPSVETWIQRFDSDLTALELKDSAAVRRAGQAVAKLAQQTRTLAVLAKMLELAMVDAPSDSDVDIDLGELGEFSIDSQSGKDAGGITAVMKSVPPAPNASAPAVTKTSPVAESQLPRKK